MSDSISNVTEVDELEIGDQIGAGGQATVYRLRSHRQMLFKQYRLDRVDSDALDRLVEWRHGLNSGDRELLDRSASWVQSRVVSKEGKTVGVLIPEAPSRFYIEVRGKTRLNEIQYLAFGERASKLGLHVPGPGVRAEVIASIADLFEMFDRHRIVHGDMSFKNLLWTVRPEPAAYLLDCDCAHIGRHPGALPQVTTQHWTDPRVQDRKIRLPDVDSDRLAIGLLFFRTYFQVRANFTGMELRFEIPSEPKLNRSTEKLINNTLHSQSGRSPAVEWQKVRDLHTFLLENSGSSPHAESNTKPSADRGSLRTYRTAAALSTPPAYDPNRTASDGSSLVGNRQQVAANANVGSQTVPKARRSGRAVRALVLLNVVLATVFVTLLILGRV